MKKIKLRTILISLLVFLLIYVVIIAVFIYAYDSNNKLVRKTENIVPYPVASWGMNFISEAKLKNNLDSIRMFYENQDFSSLGVRVDFNTEDGKKRLQIKEKDSLNKLIEDKIIENEAIKRGLRLNPEDISQEVSRKIKEYNSGEFLKNNLAKLYGWTIADFENNTVKPDMYRMDLAKNLRDNDPKSIDAKNKINLAFWDLNNGKSFEDTVKKYSQGDSAKNNGELGWFSTKEMLPEIVMAIVNLKKGDRSDIIESQIGYHIISLEDQKTENGLTLFKLKQIFVRTINFSDWLVTLEKKTSVHIYSKNLYWNKSDGQVEFRNNDLKNFEENLNKNSNGDISVMF